MQCFSLHVEFFIFFATDTKVRLNQAVFLNILFISNNVFYIFDNFLLFYDVVTRRSTVAKIVQNRTKS